MDIGDTVFFFQLPHGPGSLLLDSLPGFSPVGVGLKEREG